MSVDTSLPSPQSPGMFKKLFCFVKKTFSPSQPPPPTQETVREKMTKMLAMESERKHPAFSKLELSMFRNLLDFGTKKVDDVMVPRVDIKCIDINSPMSDLIQMFKQAHHSRIPVYNENLDHPKGMFHIKDLLQWLLRESQGGQSENTSPQKTPDDEDRQALSDTLMLSKIDLSQPIATTKLLMRDVLFVPPGMPALDLLHEMQIKHIHLALVIDEYGGTDGLVSIEDLVEEIVGEIEDEHDNGKQPPLISGNLAAGLRVSGRTPIEELEKQLKVSLKEVNDNEDIDTVGGMIVNLFGKLPERGQTITHKSGFQFEVVDVDNRKISQLLVRKSRAKP